MLQRQRNWAGLRLALYLGGFPLAPSVRTVALQLLRMKPECKFSEGNDLTRFVLGFLG